MNDRAHPPASDDAPAGPELSGATNSPEEDDVGLERLPPTRRRAEHSGHVRKTCWTVPRTSASSVRVSTGGDGFLHRRPAAGWLKVGDKRARPRAAPGEKVLPAVGRQPHAIQAAPCPRVPQVGRPGPASPRHGETTGAPRSQRFSGVTPADRRHPPRAAGDASLVNPRIAFGPGRSAPEPQVYFQPNTRACDTPGPHISGQKAGCCPWGSRRGGRPHPAI